MPKERNPRAKTPNPRADESVSTLVALPTPEEIAELLRRRPVHAVLIDICSDLGIVTADPMWIELRCALVVVTFNRDVRKRIRITNFFPPDMPMIPPALLRRPAPRSAPAAVVPTGPP